MTVETCERLTDTVLWVQGCCWNEENRQKIVSWHWDVFISWRHVFILHQTVNEAATTRRSSLLLSLTNLQSCPRWRVSSFWPRFGRQFGPRSSSVKSAKRPNNWPWNGPQWSGSTRRRSSFRPRRSSLSTTWRWTATKRTALKPLRLLLDWRVEGAFY